jgi:EAL domain-containing protein (putative c-di-GMP-specific phosphodiesterase class I)
MFSGGVLPQSRGVPNSPLGSPSDAPRVATSADGADRTPPEPRVAAEPVVDLRGGVFRLHGVATLLDFAGRSPSSRWDIAVRSLLGLSTAFPDLDLFVSFDGVDGTAAADALLAVLAASWREGIRLDRLIVNLEERLPEPLAGVEVGETIKLVRSRGVRVSISRAGLTETGLRTILETYPDVLRVSPAIASGCGSDFYRQAIVESIAGLAWKFGALVLAEGVLDANDAAWLSRAGVALGTGPYFGRPTPPESLLARLREPGLPFAVASADRPPRPPARTAGKEL